MSSSIGEFWPTKWGEIAYVSATVATTGVASPGTEHVQVRVNVVVADVPGMIQATAPSTLHVCQHKVSGKQRHHQHCTCVSIRFLANEVC